MSINETILELKEWLRRDGNTATKLAEKLGYKSSSVIGMWLFRGRIPDWQIERVRKIITTKWSKKHE